MYLSTISSFKSINFYFFLYLPFHLLSSYIFKNSPKLKYVFIYHYQFQKEVLISLFFSTSPVYLLLLFISLKIPLNTSMSMYLSIITSVKRYSFIFYTYIMYLPSYLFLYLKFPLNQYISVKKLSMFIFYITVMRLLLSLAVH